MVKDSINNYPTMKKSKINNSTTENPEADDFDIDDILAVLND
jgi:hypothetical protein